MKFVATISEEGITWSEYPFLGATVHPRGSVTWSEVLDFDGESHPPEVRTASGETLFVPAPQKTELVAAATRVGLSHVHRADVWSFLLEPYLDTEFTIDMEERVTELLDREGVSPRRAARIRDRIGDAVLRYNAVVWDWTHLGQYDLLTAHNWNDRPRSLSQVKRRRLYWWSMSIAELGQRKPRGRSD